MVTFLFEIVYYYWTSHLIFYYTDYGQLLSKCNGRHKTSNALIVITWSMIYVIKHIPMVTDLLYSFEFNLHTKVNIIIGNYFINIYEYRLDNNRLTSSVIYFNTGV